MPTKQENVTLIMKDSEPISPDGLLIIANTSYRFFDYKGYMDLVDDILGKDSLNRK